MHINEMEETTEAQPFSTELIISSISLMTLVSILAVCMCCKRRNQKSELAGIEGIVKLKHLDDSTINVSIDTTDSSDVLSPKMRLAQKNATLPFDAKLGNGNGFQDNELKRSSANAPHRSLPDIPIVETAVCDNNSELYATVGDKVQEKAQSKSPLNPKKLVNISQNSSMSQADDSSPYARVRSPQHAYDKLKKTEHPYAQVIQPMTTGGIATVVLENVDDDDDDDDDDETTIENPISHRESSNNDLLSTAESHLDASAAISGRISASQELPYMTPPIITSMTNAHNHPQHFSGDSQDSSKGYTSISVREPLANIIAQTNQQNAQRRRREIQDSHNNFYATVSDDSDEMYAAIEDPNNIGGTDLYTSGSETYAQIQAPMTVSVEINPPPPQQTSQASQTVETASTTSHRSTVRPNSSYHEETSQIDALKNIHSRQASSSSCTSSVGNNIGSPKPEKRQANSPLPPTPQNKIKDTNNNSNKTRQDVEGMYAKVMKKNKLSSVPFESTSPVLPRHEVEATESAVTEIKISSGNEYETIDKKRHRNNRNNEMINYSGYETIPADRNNNNKDENVSSIALSSNPHYAQIQEKTETIFVDENIPQYETLKLSNKQPLQQQQKGIDSITTDSDYDPNYEIVINKKQQRISSSSSTSSTLVDDGYSQIGKKLKQQKDFSDDDESIPGYSTIKKPENDYSSIGEEQRRLRDSLKMSDSENDRDSNLYSSIPAVISPSTDSNSSDLHLDYEQITSTSITPTTVNNNFELLSESSMTETSVRYVKENPYERLHNEKSPDVESISSSGKGQQQNSSSAVDDFFKV